MFDQPKRRKNLFIPWERLPDITLQNMVDSYCTQAHGLCSDDDFDSLASRRQQVLQAIKDGRLVIRWSEAEESAWIVNPDMLQDDQTDSTTPA